MTQIMKTAASSCAICTPEDYNDPLYSQQIHIIPYINQPSFQGVPYYVLTQEGAVYVGKLNKEGKTKRFYTESSETVQVWIGKEAMTRIRKEGLCHAIK